jgi:hypothetical protein
MCPSKITIFAGHYGSGKTTAAVNYALALRKVRAPVALCDMDIVNPYFRTADFEQVLRSSEVELISSPYANSNVEMPWAPAEALRVFDDAQLTSVIDLGGDDCGALAIGRYAERFRHQKDCAMWLVVNPCRPITRDVEGLRRVRDEIEAAAHLRFTGIVNSTNLGAETTAETIAAGFPLIKRLSEAMRLPVVMTCVKKDIELTLPASMGERLDITIYPNRFHI